MDAKAEALAAAAAVDEARLWSRQMAMAEIGATEKGGVNRAALSDEDRRARRLMVEWAGERGFEVATDGIANLYVRLPGRQADAAPVVTGSHLDSQPRGGKFDGAYGVDRRLRGAGGHCAGRDRARAAHRPRRLDQ